jgi:hypothetical protein
VGAVKVRSQTKQFFSPEAKELLTPFRSEVLKRIRQVAKKELGSSVESVTVSNWLNPEEPVPSILVLSIIADVDRAELRRARQAILNAIAEEASSWTEEQKEDYSKIIYFDIVPADL